MQHTTTAVSDLSWTRLTPWRRLIAQFFDSPSLQPYLDRLTAVDIEHDAGSAAQALLLAGWLAARLGWRPEAKDERRPTGCGAPTAGDVLGDPPCPAIAG